MNSIEIKSIKINGNRIDYEYEVQGEWKEAFKLQNLFFAEYSCDVSSVPESIAVIPFLANLLPMSWVYNAKIILPACDKSFFESISDFKRGYENMYPVLELKGSLEINRLVDNTSQVSKSAVFFSGGVDAFDTLIRNIDKNPVLITVWGADIKHEDLLGWKNVLAHLQQVKEKFDVKYYTVKSSLRMFLDEQVLSRKVHLSGDNWWHGFQHGLGIYCHAAPLAYLLGLKSVYFASSFTIADKGKVTCASDPTIDNYVRFCSTSIIHDGYDCTRQMKVNNISQFVKKTGIKTPLRVCWESEGGSNCCHCEKCWRTILAIYAEGENPNEYGFEYSNFGELCQEIHKNHELLKHNRDSRYTPVQNALRQNYTRNNVEPKLRWFYDINISHLGEAPLWLKAGRKMKRVLIRIIRKLNWRTANGKK